MIEQNSALKNISINKLVDWKILKAKKVDRYIKIMTDFEKVDVSRDGDFKTMFKGFYKIRRDDLFCDIYFKILETNKINKDLSFEYVLRELYNVKQNIEASFTSKLLATINPELPVWDSVVLKNIENNLTSIVKHSDKIIYSVQKYESIKEYYKKEIISPEGINKIRAFNTRFPKVDVTNIKKLDFINWQIRKHKPGTYTIDFS